MRPRGSITIFASLSFMLVAQLLFTLLEGAHGIEVAKCARMDTETVLESVFADYCTPLWENYHILGAAAAQNSGGFSLNGREAQIRNQSGISLEAGRHLLHADMVDVEFSGYTLLSDQAGKVFEEAACAYMKENLGYEAAKSLYSKYEAVRKVKKDVGSSGDKIEKAESALQESKEQEGTAATGLSAKESAEEKKNVLDTVTEAKRKGILSYVLPQSANLSGRSLLLDQTVSHRRLMQGTKRKQEEGDWYRKILMNQYLLEHLSCYTSQKEKRALTYELEYILAGRGKDADNLKTVVQEMLGLREVLNMASIVSMPEKQAEAMTLALTIAGASVNPVIIEAVKYGILAAWAFVESVMDMRTLLSGGKIATIKSELDWTSGLDRIPELLSGGSGAKQNAKGMGYKDYLGLMLLFHSDQKASMRAMDVEEAYIRQLKGYELFQMDHMLCEAEILSTYSYEPVFLGFVSLLETKENRFCIRVRSRYSCLRREGGV